MRIFSKTPKHSWSHVIKHHVGSLKLMVSICNSEMGLLRKLGKMGNVGERNKSDKGKLLMHRYKGFTEAHLGVD